MKEYTSYKIRLKPTIVMEAMRCFQERGIRAVKMDDIAHNLGISKRTLYELYSNKEDLLVEVIRKLFGLRKQRIQEIRQESDNIMDLLLHVLGLQLETAATTNSGFYMDLKRYPRAEKVLLDYYNDEHQSSSQFFEQGVREGFFLPSINYAVLQRITASTMRMIKTSEDFSDVAYDELFMNFIYPSIRGICTAKGMEKIDLFVAQRFPNP